MKSLYIGVFGVLLLMLGIGQVVFAQSNRHGFRSPINHSLIFSKSQKLGPVYYSQHAQPGVKQAAQELAHYLSLVSGHEWTAKVQPEGIAGPGIFVGKTINAYAEFAIFGDKVAINELQGADKLEAEQSFRIVVVPDAVYLSGGSPRATAFSVYYFLQQHLGVRWYTPGEIGEEIPEMDRFQLMRSDRVIKPSFINRAIGGLTEVNMKNWALPNLISKRWASGHRLQELISPDLFEEHPDWFAQVNGKRIPTAGGRGPNPNIANPEVAEHVAQAAEQYFTQNPGQSIFSIGITDSLTFDQSELTKKLINPQKYFRNRPVYSELVFHFANAVADDIWPLNECGGIDSSDVPADLNSRYLSCLAYYWAEQVPSFKVHPRVIPYLTSDRAQWFDSEYKKEDKALIEAWTEAGPDIVGTWDYYEGAPYFIPRFYPGLISESIKFLHSSGVQAFYAEGAPLWGFDGPKYWLASQLLWNVERDPVSLLSDYFNGYYRESAAPMWEFFALCEKQWMEQEGDAEWIKYFYNPSQAELFPEPVLAALNDYLKSAETMAKTPRVKARIAILRSEFEFTSAAVKYYFAWKALANATGSDDMRVDHFKKARLHLEATNEPNPLSHKKVKQSLLQLNPLSNQVVRPENYQVVINNDFSKPFVEGDETGLTSQDLRRIKHGLSRTQDQTGLNRPNMVEEMSNDLKPSKMDEKFSKGSKKKSKLFLNSTE